MLEKDKAIVIGVGNTDRGDDGVGLCVARELQRKTLPGIRVCEHGGEAATLIEKWQGYEMVIVVDAMSSGARPGEILRCDATADSLPEAFQHVSSHSFGVHEAIELARVLGQLPDKLIVFGVESTAFEPGSAMTPAVEQTVEPVCQQILDELNCTRGVADA